jgi:hypothetical protein
MRRIFVLLVVLASVPALVVTGWPARNGSNEMRARIMTLEDGTEYRLSPGGGPQQGGGMGQAGMGMGMGMGMGN